MTRSRLPWLCATLVAVAYGLTLLSLRVPQRAPEPFVAAHEESSPWVPDYAPQLATITALLLGTATAVPSATRPPYPTATAPTSCTGELPAQTDCFAPTVEPTPYPTNVLPTPPPLPTWPGADQATPGVHYQMSKSEGTP